jgi:hypothetical protein
MADPAFEIQISDAIVASLNGHTFSLKFNKATREYLPTLDLEEMTGLYVLVAPHSTSGKRLDRDDVQYDYAVMVGLSQKTDGSKAMLDPLMTFKQEVGDWFQQDEIEILPGVWQVLFDNTPIYDPEKLRSSKLFQSVLTFGYRTSR